MRCVPAHAGHWPLLLFLLCMGQPACAPVCIWEGDTCLAVELSGEFTLQGALMRLGLQTRHDRPRTLLPEGRRLPLVVTAPLPQGIDASEVTSVEVCARDAGSGQSLAGAAALLWTPGTHVHAVVRLEPTDTDPCADVSPPPPTPETPAQVPSPRFLVRQMRRTGLPPLLSVALGDFFDRGRRDLAVLLAPPRSELILLPALGDGSFGPGIGSAPSLAPDRLLAADVDGDRRTDLIGSNRSLGAALSYPRQGPGKLAPDFHLSFSQMGAAPADLLLADLTGDPQPELVLADSQQAGQLVVVALPDRKFKVSASGGAYPEAMGSADMNGDGWNDIVVTHRGSGETRILYNDRSGMLLVGPPVAQCAGPVGVQVADLNRDGLRDLVVLCRATPMIQILLTTAQAGGFLPPVLLPLEEPPRFLSTGDFNHDGHQDIATLHDSGTLHFYLGGGAQQFRAENDSQVKTRNPIALVADDLNQDGQVDLLLAGEQEITALLSQ